MGCFQYRGDESAVVEELIGKTLVKVERRPSKTATYSDCIIFICEDGTEYEMSHSQD